MVRDNIYVVCFFYGYDQRIYYVSQCAQVSDESVDELERSLRECHITGSSHSEPRLTSTCTLLDLTKCPFCHMTPCASGNPRLCYRRPSEPRPCELNTCPKISKTFSKCSTCFPKSDSSCDPKPCFSNHSKCPVVTRAPCSPKPCPSASLPPSLSSSNQSIVSPVTSKPTPRLSPKSSHSKSPRTPRDVKKTSRKNSLCKPRPCFTKSSKCPAVSSLLKANPCPSAAPPPSLPLRAPNRSIPCTLSLPCEPKPCTSPKPCETPVSNDGTCICSEVASQITCSINSPRSLIRPFILSAPCSPVSSKPCSPRGPETCQLKSTALGWSCNEAPCSSPTANQSLSLCSNVEKALSRNIQLQNPDFENKGSLCKRNVDELYFNDGMKKSDAADDWPQLLDDQGAQCLESTPVSSAACACAPASGSDVKLNSSECIKLESASSGGTCDAARAKYYHTKLISTLQVLQNKEDTVKVQGESLSVAESMIKTLNTKLAQLKKDWDQKMKEEAEKQKNVVSTLQTNLSVIQELYGECFYEAVKQDELIEKLRSSNIDVRMMEKEKADEVGRLQNIINNQKWSVDRCQDIAAEVENLKSEISNFLNSSNNDSGMWERSEDSMVSEVNEELQEIMEQLVTLGNLLAADCSCALEDENRKLKAENATIRSQLNELCQKACSLDEASKQKDYTVKLLEKQNQEKDLELQMTRIELQKAQEKESEKAKVCCCLETQLKQIQEILISKNEELVHSQQQRITLDASIQKLQEELEKADQQINENCEVRNEVSCLSQEVALWRQQLAESEERVRSVEAELMRVRSHCRALDQCCREKIICLRSVEEQLASAQARGAALCSEARIVVNLVRGWLQDMRTTHKLQQEKIKEQEATICHLECELQAQQKENNIKQVNPFCSLGICEKLAKAEVGIGLGRDEPSQLYLEDEKPSCSKIICPKIVPKCCRYKQKEAKIGCSKCAKNIVETSDVIDGIGCSKCAKNHVETSDVIDSIGCTIYVKTPNVKPSMIPCLKHLRRCSNLQAPESCAKRLYPCSMDMDMSLPTCEDTSDASPISQTDETLPIGCASSTETKRSVDRSPEKRQSATEKRLSLTEKRPSTERNTPISINSPKTSNTKMRPSTEEIRPSQELERQSLTVKRQSSSTERRKSTSSERRQRDVPEEQPSLMQRLSSSPERRNIEKIERQPSIIRHQSVSLDRRQSKTNERQLYKEKETTPSSSRRLSQRIERQGSIIRQQSPPSERRQSIAERRQSIAEKRQPETKQSPKEKRQPTTKEIRRLSLTRDKLQSSSDRKGEREILGCQCARGNRSSIDSASPRSNGGSPSGQLVECKSAGTIAPARVSVGAGIETIVVRHRAAPVTSHAPILHQRPPSPPPRSLSPSADILQRMERLQEAFEAGQRRWTKPRPEQR